MKLLKLGQMTKDKATGLEGMLIHIQIGLEREVYYNFQPRGINPETGHPVAASWVTAARLQAAGIKENYDLPLDVLGTEVTDEASGFHGTAISLTVHINGCIHVVVQAPGRLEKTGAAIKPDDFDIRRLSGKAIKPMTEEERKESKRKNPSPEPVEAYSPQLRSF